MYARSGFHDNLHAKRICYARRVSFSIGSFSKTVETKKNHISHSLYECPFKQETSKWNSYLATDKYFESGVVKIQQGRAVDENDIENNACRKLLKSYKVIEDEDEDEDKDEDEDED